MSGKENLKMDKHVHEKESHGYKSVVKEELVERVDQVVRGNQRFILSNCLINFLKFQDQPSTLS